MHIKSYQKAEVTVPILVFRYCVETLYYSVSGSLELQLLAPFTAEEFSIITTDAQTLQDIKGNQFSFSI